MEHSAITTTVYRGLLIGFNHMTGRWFVTEAGGRGFVAFGLRSKAEAQAKADRTVDARQAVRS